MWSVKRCLAVISLFLVLLVGDESSGTMVGSFAPGDAYGGGGCHYVPQGGSYKSVWIFLHGLGDTCDGWKSAFEEFLRRESRLAESFKIILPTAETRPISLNRGWPMPGWFDISSLDSHGLEDDKGMTEAGNRIQKMIDGELGKGIANKRIIVGGFSQGAAVGYYVGLRGVEPVGAITALSGWMPMREKLMSKLSEAGEKPRIIHCHGTADDMVKFEYGAQTAELLKSKGYPVEFKTYPNMSHSTCATELADLLGFVLNL